MSSIERQKAFIAALCRCEQGKVNGFCEALGSQEPFVMINLHDELDIKKKLVDAGIGLPSSRANILCQVAGQWVYGLIDLETCTQEQLCKIKGVGKYTVRKFMELTGR